VKSELEPVRKPEGRASSAFPWRAVVLSALLTVILVLLPPGFLWLFPLLLLAWREGGLAAWSAAAGAWLLIGVLMGLGAGSLVGTLSGLGLVSLFGLAGALFGTLAIRGRSLALAGGAAVLPLVLFSAVIIASAMITDPAGVAAAWEQIIASARAEFLAQLQASAGFDETLQVDGIRQFLTKQHLWILYLFPGSLGLVLLVMLWTNLWVVKSLEPAFAGEAPLSQWRTPEAWFWGLIGGLAMTLAGLLGDASWPLAIGINLLMLGGGIYFLSGLAVMSFVGARWGTALWLLLGLVVVFTMPGSLMGIALLGVVDFWLDLRKRWIRDDDSSAL